MVGALEPSMAIYRSILAVKHDHPDTNHLMGILLVLTCFINHMYTLLVFILFLSFFYMCTLHYLKGQIGDSENSLHHLKKAITLNPSNYNYYNTLGEALRKLKNYDAALGYFKKAMELFPNFLAAKFKMAFAYKDSAKIEAAIKANEHVAVSNFFTTYPHTCFENI